MNKILIAMVMAGGVASFSVGAAVEQIYIPCPIQGSFGKSVTITNNQKIPSSVPGLPWAVFLHVDSMLVSTVTDTSYRATRDTPRNMTCEGQGIYPGPKTTETPYTFLIFDYTTALPGYSCTPTNNIHDNVRGFNCTKN